MKIKRFLLSLICLCVAFALLPSCSQKEITKNPEKSIFAPAEQNKTEVKSQTDATKKADSTKPPEKTFSAEEPQAFPDITKEYDTTKPMDEAVPKEESKALPETQDDAMTCTLAVRCDDVFNHLDKLKKEKIAILADDGIVFPMTKVSFSEGESVFDVLNREMKNAGIHLEFVNTPAYNSVYIEGINNLYEFDCGSTSGWTYTVNGESPMHGCSQHKVKKDDKIEFIYKCSLY